jgi:NADH dehydrogenase
MTVLVVGATGFVGQQIAVSLKRRNHDVRGLVRGGARSPKAAGLLSAGVRVIEGDLRDPATLASACSGVEAVVCTVTTMPTGADDGLRRVDHEGVLALMEAAEGAGVRKFVYTSYSGNLRTPSALETAKRECEARLLRGRMQAVVLRPSYFLEVWLGPHLGVDPVNGSVRIYGSGNGKVSYISGVNVAEYGVAAVERETGRQAVLEMGGPEALSQLDAVRVFERVLGVSCRLEFVPVEALRARHESPDPLQNSFGALMLNYDAGDVIPGAAALASEYGVTLRSVADYAATLRAPAAGV